MNFKDICEKHFIKYNDYCLEFGLSDLNEYYCLDNKNKDDFNEKIHAIVKITELDILPYSTYNCSNR